MHARKRAFDWHQIEIEKSCGAHQKYLNEDRHKLSAAKCRSMILLSKNKNIKYTQRFEWTPFKDRPSKDISDDTAGISLFFASLRMTSHRPVGDVHYVRKQLAAKLFRAQM